MDVRLHSNWNTIAGQGQAWNRLLDQSESTNVFLRHEYLSKWWKLFGGAGQPYIVEVLDGESTIGFAPLQSPAKKSDQESPQLSMIGYFADYCGCVVRVGRERAFVETLFDFFVDQVVADVSLDHLREDSALYGAVVDLCRSREMRHSPIAITRAPFVKISGSWDEYTRTLSGNTYRDLKKKLNRFRRVDGLLITEIRDLSAYQDHVSRMIEMHLELWAARKTRTPYQVPERRMFLREVGWALLQQGILRLACLQVSDKPIAYLWCYDYKRVRHYLNAAWDMGYANLSPGSLLLIQGIRDAFELGFDEFDMLGGEEAFKYRYTHRSHHVTTLKIINPGKARRHYAVVHRHPPSTAAAQEENLLVIAHPDDEAIFFSGLLKQNPRERWTCCLVTNPTTSPSVGAHRLWEFERSCQLLGLEPVLLQLDSPPADVHLDIRTVSRLLGDRLDQSRFRRVFCHGIFGEYGNIHHADICLAVHQVFDHVFSVAGPFRPVISLHDEGPPGFPGKKEYFNEVYYSQNMMCDLVSRAESFVRLPLELVRLLHDLLFFGEPGEKHKELEDGDGKRLLADLLPRILTGYFKLQPCPDEILEAVNSVEIDVITPLQLLSLHLVRRLLRGGAAEEAAFFIRELERHPALVMPGANEAWQKLKEARGKG